MNPNAPQPDGDNDRAEKPSLFERLAEHGDTVLTWVSIGFVITAVTLLVSLYRKLNNT